MMFAAAVGCGCSNTANLLTTGSAPPTVAQTISTDTQSRLHQVAGTSARGKRCGFNFDATHLKTSYLNYEMRQGATSEQVAKISQSYDATVIRKLNEVEANPDYCSDRVTSLIKSALERHKAGDFAPTRGDPQAIVGVRTPQPEAFDGGKFFAERARDPATTR